MVKLYQQGMYYIGGNLVQTLPAAEGINKGAAGTMAYRILQKHNTSGDAKALQIRFDKLISHDITYVGIIQT